MHAIFMIEGGRALEMVKAHIEERRRVLRASRAIAGELGAPSFSEDRMNGTLLGVVFPGAIHPDFKKAKGRHTISYPKKGTAWEKRLAEQQGYKPVVRQISGAFSIPLSLTYTTEGGSGGSIIGSPFRECGFLYPGPDGPYAMWVPDVPAEVARQEAKGHVVTEPAKSFRLEFDGCRRIESEEWEILMLQHKLRAKKG